MHMSDEKVYLRGAYGPSNLGDDVLLICMINILKEVFKSEEIVVGVEDVAAAKRIDPKVNWIHYKKPCHVKYFIYGGGGQFFSFDNSNLNRDGFIQKLFKSLKNQDNLISLIQRIMIKRNESAMESLVVADKVASYCIGFGPFEIKNRDFVRAKKFIGRADYISFRDEKSNFYYKQISGMANAKVYSDPTFDTDIWLGSNFPVLEDKSKSVYDYSYVLRDWPFDKKAQDKIDKVLAHARSKKDKGYKVRLVSFSKIKDSNIINRVTDIEWLIYDAKKDIPNKFLEELAFKSLVVITTRAHGAWLLASYQKPTVIIAIENKLRQVNKSLINSTVLCEADSLEDIENGVAFFKANYETLKKSISNDCKKGLELALASKSDFIGWLRKNEADN